MDHQHYPTKGSTLSYRRINIILPTILHYQHPTNGPSSVLSYQLIIVNHPIDGASPSSYRWSSIIILSMEHYHHPIDGVASSSYQWSIIIILSME
ncbi:hypothetical protein KY290_036149 [Solanum tuberosum]|uniref:Uncharacterized protein n=1 Tax=Solanum tuberosum TaxID=4113 RepID=A0ABQ7TT78_SOLTU|nr:hypothetical protein KY290_036149 [Solanum tuberosum]